MQAHQDDWAARAFERPDPHEWITANAAALARVSLAQEIEAMITEPEQLTEETKDDEK